MKNKIIKSTLLKSEKYIYIVVVLMTLSFFGCSDDEDGGDFPSVRTELVEAMTGNDKNVKEIRLDNGKTYNVSQSIGTNTADTIYRCVCSYVYDSLSRKLSVYSLTVVPSSYPIDSKKLPPEQSGPFKLFSTWITNRYINAYLSYQTTSKNPHRFLFVEDSITVHSNGTRCANVRLFHEVPADDPSSYSQKQYVSFPSYYYHGKTDTIHLEIDDKTIIALP